MILFLFDPWQFLSLSLPFMTSAFLSKLMNYFAGFKYLNLWHIVWWLIQVMQILEELSSDILPPRYPQRWHTRGFISLLLYEHQSLSSCFPLVINRELCWAALKLCKHPVSWETFTSGFGMLTFTAMDMNMVSKWDFLAPSRTLAGTVDF